MRFIGPIVRNDLFFFVTMLALAGLMMLLEYKRRAPTILGPNASLPPTSAAPSGPSAARRCG